MTPNLSTRYLGMTLANPLVAAASPLTGQLSNLVMLEQSGAAAAVMMSLFQEQVDGDQLDFERIRGGTPGDLSMSEVYLPRFEDYNCGPNSYLRHLEAAKRAVSIPIIASLNGSRSGPWTRYARLIEQAGADALELNIYFIPTDPELTGQEVEDRYIELVSAVRAEVSIPLAVKLSDSFTALPNMTRRLAMAGANGLVLFNRMLQPDINLQSFAVQPILSLSHPEELRSRLRWIAILSREFDISLAGTGGAESAEDVVKLLLAGADVAMVASALLRHGPQHVAVMLQGLTRWLAERGFESVDHLRGLISQQQRHHIDTLERANYMRAITSGVERLREPTLRNSD